LVVVDEAAPPAFNCCFRHVAVANVSAVSVLHAHASDTERPRARRQARENHACSSKGGLLSILARKDSANASRVAPPSDWWQLQIAGH
jgi:hypothetical protein